MVLLENKSVGVHCLSSSVRVCMLMWCVCICVCVCVCVCVRAVIVAYLRSTITVYTRDTTLMERVAAEKGITLTTRRKHEDGCLTSLVFKLT